MTVTSATKAPLAIQIRNLTLLLGGTMTVMAAAVISPALPAIETNFAANENAAFFSRLTLTMPALFIALTAPFAGFLLDRIGRRPVILFSLLLYSVAGMAGFYLESLSALLVSRAVLGIAIAGTMSGFTTLIGDFFKDAGLDRFMGLQAMANSFGGLVFLVLGGLLAEASWHAPFLIYGIALLVLPLFWSFVPEPEIENHRPENSLSSSQSSLIHWPTIVMLYGVGLLSMLLFYVIPVQLPFALQEMGIGGAFTGFALGLMALVSAGTAAQYMSLHARLSYQTIFACVFGLMAVGFVILGLTSSYLTILIGLFIIGIGIGPMLPNINVWLVNSTSPLFRGRLVSGLSSAFFLGQFLSPLVAQPVVDQAGTSGIFLLTATVLVIMAITFWLANRH